MLDFSQASPQMVGFAVFIGLLAVRCGLLWLTGSAVVALIAASDHMAVLARVSALLQALEQWLVAGLGAGGG